MGAPSNRRMEATRTSVPAVKAVARPDQLTHPFSRFAAEIRASKGFRNSNSSVERLSAKPVLGREHDVLLLDAAGRFPKGARQPEEGSVGHYPHQAEPGGQREQLSLPPEEELANHAIKAGPLARGRADSLGQRLLTALPTTGRSVLAKSLPRHRRGSPASFAVA